MYISSTTNITAIVNTIEPVVVKNLEIMAINAKTIADISKIAIKGSSILRILL